MINVAVVSEEKSFFDLLITHYNRLPLYFHWFKDTDSFTEQLKLEQWHVLLMINRDFDRLHDWLVKLSENKVEIPIVCSTPIPTTDDRQLLWQLGVREIIPWPVHRQELEFILKSFHEFLAPPDEEGEYLFQGSLEFINGIDLLRMFGKKSCDGILHFQWAERKGRVEFKEGQIVHASYRQMDPLTSVLVLSSWNHGFAFFKPDQYVSRRSIMLANEQIFSECREYFKERESLLKLFPSVYTPLYPHPDLNYEDFGHSERQLLHQMRKGKCLEEIKNTYEGDFNFLLKKLTTWFEKHYILPEKQYQSIKAEKEKEDSAPAFRRLVQKIFNRKESSVEETFSSDFEPELQAEEESRKEYFFNQKELLEKINRRLEE
ncbi:MAG: DUF4388 domain-containing protein [Calditrichaeota bacterium]|nr:DUF4388 domain-containing protein [Calditrichota bacterium]